MSKLANANISFLFVWTSSRNNVSIHLESYLCPTYAYGSNNYSNFSSVLVSTGLVVYSGVYHYFAAAGNKVYECRASVFSVMTVNVVQFSNEVNRNFN